MEKSIEYYVSLPYTKVIRRDEEGDFVAKIEELPGCVAHGATEEEAIKSLKEVMASWIEECLSAGQPVPEPAPEEALPSGKWVQRVPRSLHRKLALTAKVEGVSLNHLVTTLLSEAVGMRLARVQESKWQQNAEHRMIGWSRDPEDWVIDHRSGPLTLAAFRHLVGALPKRYESTRRGTIEEERHVHARSAR